MKKLILSEDKKVWYLPENTIVETYISDEMPPIELCASSYAFVFKNGALLQIDLREGERPTRQLDIPGGHVDSGEHPEESIVREVFEETGVVVKVSKLIACKKVIVKGEKPSDWKYPYPDGYMLFYLCEIVEEKDFDGNEDTHGRVWLSKNEYDKSEWYRENKILVDEVFKYI